MGCETILRLYMSGRRSKYLKKPWEARDHYIDILLDRSLENIEAFFQKEAARELTKEEKAKVLKLLEAQRNGMLMYHELRLVF